ncbi:MAG: peptidylprolyl isomerase [Leptolyngbyaceae cyanobacterium SM2_5_2]|nr:peptidylprolyl isomerase [Leptolyngbyaceae cyanobacterium SM2_5_2]
MGLNTRLFKVTLAALLALWVGACATSSPVDSTTTEAPAEPEATESVTAADPAAIDPALPRLEGTATVELMVNGESILVEVDGMNAPVTAGNFVDLVNRGVYDGLSFHRVVRDPQPFVVQGGDPLSGDPNVPSLQLGTGSFIDPDTQAPRYIPLEIKPEGEDNPLYSQTFEDARLNAAPQLAHRRGAVAMARSQAPDTASSQFYIALADLPVLDGSYAVFGYVTEGMEVVDGIQQGDRIESARVIDGLDNLKTN